MQAERCSTNRTVAATCHGRKFLPETEIERSWNESCWVEQKGWPFKLLECLSAIIIKHVSGSMIHDPPRNTGIDLKFNMTFSRWGSRISDFEATLLSCEQTLNRAHCQKARKVATYDRFDGVHIWTIENPVYLNYELSKSSALGAASELASDHFQWSVHSRNRQAFRTRCRNGGNGFPLKFRR